jgi:NAD(P)-dependent dehydrogenase (short-subunit alcohol dehydrogenase family)
MMKTVLITGGNKGIGLETTKQFLNNGWKVIVLARNATDLELDCTKLDVDLTNITAIKELPNKVGDIDILVNNAGVMYGVDFRAYDEDKKRDILKLNLEELLLHHSNPVLQAKYFGVIFNEAPTYVDIVSGTPDCSKITGVNSVFVPKKLNNNLMAGVEGFEPPNAWTKTMCLTTWRHPNVSKIIS